jgi:hypothetical protein
MNIIGVHFLFLVSCFLFLVSCFLFPDSCFLFPVSCFLFLCFFVSCFLFLVSSFLFLVSYFLLLISHFLFLISCFLSPVSCFLFPISTFLFLISSIRNSGLTGCKNLSFWWKTRQVPQPHSAREGGHWRVCPSKYSRGQSYLKFKEIFGKCPTLPNLVIALDACCNTLLPRL